MLYPINENLYFQRLIHPIFSDVMFASKLHRKGYKYAYVFAKDFECSRLSLMSTQSKEHETFLALFAKDGVLFCSFCDNTKINDQG